MIFDNEFMKKTFHLPMLQKTMTKTILSQKF